MTARSSRIAAFTLAGTSVLMLVTGDLLVLVHHLQHGPRGYAYWLEGSTAAITWVAVGLVLAVRVPGNSLGWLALGFVVVAASQNLAGALGAEIASDSGPRILVDWLAAVSAFCQLAAVGGMVVFAQLAPTGRPVTPRWRPVIGLTVLSLIAMGLHNAVTDSGVRSLVATAHSPITVSRRAADALFVLGNVPLGPCVALAVAGVVVRMRSGTSTERQQLKWIVFAVLTAVTLGAIVQPLGNVFWPHAIWAGSVLWALIGASLPVGTTVAILRYRLYDIDRIVSRTVGYAAVTGLLVGVYLGLVVLTSRLLPFSSSFGVAASALAAAALFQPARRRVQTLVDRKFNRQRYDASRVVEAFSLRLRDEVDVQTVHADLVDTVDRVVQPGRLSVWLAGDAQ